MAVSVGRRGRPDRRHSLRFPAECKVVYWSSGGWREARLMNLSRGGALVRFLHGTKVNEGVHLLLQQHGEQHRLAVNGLVRALDNAGVHIQFNAGQTDVDGWVRRVIRTQVLPPIMQRLRSDPADVVSIAEIAAWYRELGDEVDAPAAQRDHSQGGIAAADLDRVRGVLAKRREQLYTQFKALLDEQQNVAELERHLRDPAQATPGPGAAPLTASPPPLEIDETSWPVPTVASTVATAPSARLGASSEAPGLSESDLLPDRHRAYWVVASIVGPVVATLILLIGVAFTLRWASYFSTPAGDLAVPTAAPDGPANVVHLAPQRLPVVQAPVTAPLESTDPSPPRGRAQHLSSRAAWEPSPSQGRNSRSSDAEASPSPRVPPPQSSASPVAGEATAVDPAPAPPPLPPAPAAAPGPDPLERAASLLKEHKILLAISTLRDHLVEKPHDPETLRLLAVAYLAVGNESEAAAALEDLVASAPNHKAAAAARRWLEQRNGRRSSR